MKSDDIIDLLIEQGQPKEKTVADIGPGSETWTWRRNFERAHARAEQAEKDLAFWYHMCERARCGCLCLDCVTHGSYVAEDVDRVDREQPKAGFRFRDLRAVPSLQTLGREQEVEQLRRGIEAIAQGMVATDARSSRLEAENAKLRRQLELAVKSSKCWKGAAQAGNTEEGIHVAGEAQSFDAIARMSGVEI